MSFRERLKSFGFETYEDYSLSDRWYEFRYRWYSAETTDKKCQVCGTPKIQLHHWTYARVCEEELTDVIGLCRAHHVQVHEWLKERKLSVKSTSEAIAGIKNGDNPTAERAKPARQLKRKKRKVKKPRVINKSKCTYEGCINTAKMGNPFCGLHRPMPTGLSKCHLQKLKEKRKRGNQHLEIVRKLRMKLPQPKPLEGKALSKAMSSARDVESIKEFDRQRAREVRIQRKALGLD